MASWRSGPLVEELIARAERKLGSQFIDIVLAMRKHHDLETLATFIEAGQIDAALAMTESYASQLGSAVNSIYVGAGQAAIDSMGDALGIVVNFDQVNARAVRFMAENKLELVREFTQKQTEATLEALRDGVRRGINPREMAREFRSSIGLTRTQEQHVLRYRQELESLSPRALERKLRDARFDGTIRDAIDHESPLSRAQVDRMVARYRDRKIKWRAEVIARNESLQNVHAATDESIRQAVESGAVDELKAESEWHTAKDERVRDPKIGAQTSHRTMHGQKRRFGEPFESGAGNLLRYPGDPSAPTSETLLCRCRVSTRVSL